MNLQQLFGCLPLTGYPGILGRKISFHDDWLAHPDYDSYWRPATVGDGFNKIEVPVYSIGNWYDIFARSTVESFRRLREAATTEEVKRSHKLLMGVGAHGLPSRNLGERDFGESATLDFQTIERRWFDRWLRDEDNGITTEAPVRLFVMGVNQWRDEQEWPLARTRYTNFYLHSDGKANTLSGDRTLSIKLPAKERPDEFRYDPNNPVPTTGGCNMTLPAGLGWNPRRNRSGVRASPADWPKAT